jgi:hypothetical protein
MELVVNDGNGPVARDVAETLDKELRTQARSIAASMERFRELIAEAKASQVHVVLGFKSWPDYIADVVNREMGKLHADDRRQIVALLAGEGMSNPAIGNALGVDQSTVYRDKQGLQNANPAPAPAVVTGLDNKQYRKPKPKPDVPKPKAVESEEDVPDEPEEPEPEWPTAVGDEWMRGRFSAAEPYSYDYISRYIPGGEALLAAEVLEDYVKRVEALGAEPLGKTLPKLAYLKAQRDSGSNLWPITTVDDLESVYTTYDDWDAVDRAAAEREVAAELAGRAAQDATPHPGTDRPARPARERGLMRVNKTSAANGAAAKEIAMTTYLIAGRRTIRVDGDDLTVRQSGDLWILRATSPKPAPLTPVLILARGEWTSVMVEGANVLFTDQPSTPSPSSGSRTPREVHILPATPTP